jgi:integrase/recombinase XerD
MFKTTTRPAASAERAAAAEGWLAEFDDYMRNERGLSVATRRGRRSVISRFLSELVTAGNPLTGLTIRDVDGFLQSLGEQQGGYSRASLQMVASCLRPFFRYAATRGWCRDGLADAIKSPRVYSLDSVPIGPSWEDVTRLLASTEGKKPTDIRARAILMLLAIYGLRAGEVKLLQLDDFDWKGELLSVSCSKTRRRRIFPLSRLVGDAVLLYIKQVRPRTRHREVFLTLDGRPLKDIYMIVSPRLRRLGVTIPCSPNFY